ncbi:hypothetical protein L7F22_027025 [Adiantum nelumboides]|nr:hypothetical protein [Adiantum nelumboides]
MGKLVSPAAFARALSLQRANARAKSSRAEGLSHDEKPSPPDGELSKRIDVLLTTISCSSIAIHSKDDIIDKASTSPNRSAIKRSHSQDIPFNAFKACLPTLSERIERGLDLWDRDFSSMSSCYTSDFEGFLCGLQRGVDSGCSSSQLGFKGKREDASSSSCTSWSEASFQDEIMQSMDEQASLTTRLQGSDSCKGGPLYPDFVRRADDSEVFSTEPSKIASTQRKKVDIGGGNKLVLVTHDIEGVEQDDNAARCGSHALCDKHLKAGSMIRKGAFLDREKEGIDIVSSTKSGYHTQNGSSQVKGSFVDGCLSDIKYRVVKERESLSTKELPDRFIVGAAAAAAAELPSNSVAVEKVSVNPVEDFRESMLEMMIEKGDVEEDMEELLNCYLLLNPAELHQMIREAFSHVWIDIIMSIR